MYPGSAVLHSLRLNAPAPHLKCHSGCFAAQSDRGWGSMRMQDLRQMHISLMRKHRVPMQARDQGMLHTTTRQVCPFACGKQRQLSAGVSFAHCTLA